MARPSRPVPEDELEILKKYLNGEVRYKDIGALTGKRHTSQWLGSRLVRAKRHKQI